MEITREWMDELRQVVDTRHDQGVRQRLSTLRAADISDVLDQYDAEDSRYVLSLLPREVSAEIVSNLEPEVRRRFLRTFESAELAAYVVEFDSDDAADILNEQPIRVREEVIALIDDPQVATDVLDLLRYEPDHAGGLMAKELIKVNANWTVTECIEEIRRQAENVEKVFSIYVVDDAEKLLGRISLKKLILTPGHRRVADFYERDIVVVESHLHEEEVADIMQRYDLEAVPVVNVQGKLLGRITIDDVVDVITEQAEKDQQAMAGISEDRQGTGSVQSMVRSRLPWLLIGMVGGLLGARFISVFEADLALVPAMAFFIPLITATGGNVGIQSATVVVQSMASRSNIGRNFWPFFGQTLVVAFFNAIVISGVVFSFALLLGEQRQLAAVVALALFTVVMLASVTGSVTPLILDRFNINPALASGPFITTANDLLGLGVYFTVAHFLYGL